MLLELHIRNMALIEKADLDFRSGFTVLSGETGAGKSILIDSINFALGAKTSKEIIREGAEFAYVELIFKILDKGKIEYIKSLDFNILEDGILIISRKLSTSRSILKVNDESITIAKLSTLTGLLIDIHGQHEHQSLLSKAKHLSIVDGMLDKEALALKATIQALYDRYKEIKNKLSLDDDSFIREREIDILKYEIREIEISRLKPNEEEKLNMAYRKLKAVSNINDNLTDVIEILDNTDIGSAVTSLEEISSFSPELKEFEQELYDLDAKICDINRDIKAYFDKLDYSEENFEKIQKRLDFVNRFTNKYTSDTDKLAFILKTKKERLRDLLNFDSDREKLGRELENLEMEFTDLSSSLRLLRKKVAKILEENIKNNLIELNFINVEFKIEFKELDNFSANGLDDIEFMISTNPGNPLKPLKDVASGGELSRVMLAFKSVLANVDDIDTLIFDEIDTGISGRTAQKVAEKISYISKEHQVLCITHLPQIAAMADCNYLIEKSSDGIETKTSIENIKDESLVLELARLLGGSEITKAVLDTAKEMKELANKYKNR
jgi:DNA repair protein RecN